jgi:hypothetical protein
VNLDEFMNQTSRIRNAYVEHPDWADLYIRHTKRFVERIYYPKVVDLANIRAKNPRTGAFTRLVSHLREKYPDMGIFVESVLNRSFAEKLPSLGFKYVGPSEFCPCYFMPPAEEVHA